MTMTIMQIRNAIFMKKMKLKAYLMMSKYKFHHWVFKWNQDEDGAIVFSVVGAFHFIKYKEHTIFKFGKKNYDGAAKYYVAE